MCWLFNWIYMYVCLSICKYAYVCIFKYKYIYSETVMKTLKLVYWLPLSFLNIFYICYFCLFIVLSHNLFFNSFIYFFLCSFIYWFIYFFICLFIYLFVYLFIVFIHLLVYLLIYYNFIICRLVWLFCLFRSLEWIFRAFKQIHIGCSTCWCGWFWCCYKRSFKSNNWIYWRKRKFIQSEISCGTTWWLSDCNQVQQHSYSR